MTASVATHALAGLLQVNRAHRDAFTVDYRAAATAFDDQAKRRRGMAMGPGNLPGITTWMLAISVLLAAPASFGVGQAAEPGVRPLGTDELGRRIAAAADRASATGMAPPCDTVQF